MNNRQNKEHKNKTSFYDWCIENNRSNLLDEWNYKRNGNLTPQTISHGSHKNIWWIKHYYDITKNKTFNLEWQATLQHRKRGDDCPYLSVPIKKVLNGFNDLSTTHPRLYSEIDFEENEKHGISIDSISFGSDKEIFWIGKCGHTFKAKISDRARGQNCPYCAGKQILIGFNDLPTQAPDLMKEWDYEKNAILPETITKGSAKKVWWKCREGHQWIASPNSRTNKHNQTGCPICSNRKIVKGINDLATKFPEIAAQWDYEKNGSLTPDSVTSGSNRKVWWQCNICNQSWEAKITHRTFEKTDCPICAGRKIASGYNDLATVFPNLLNEWDFDKNDISPESLSPNSKIKVWWICPRGHSYLTSIVSRTRMKTGCPECAKPYQSSISEKIVGVYLKKHFNDIIFNYHPKWLDGKELDIFIPSLKVAIEYDGGLWHKSIQRDLQKDNICANNNVELIRIRDDTCPYYKSSAIKIHTKKANGANFELNEPILELIKYLNQKYNCKISEDVNIQRDIKSILNEIDLLEIEKSVYNSPLITEWNYNKNDGLDPKFVSISKSHLKVWWVCKICGYEWETSPYVRSSMGCGCPACNHKVTVKGKTLGDMFPDISRDWDYESNALSPFDFLPSSNKKVWWICKNCGYKYQSTISHKVSRNQGCPLCSHQILVKGINDLATTYNQIALDWDKAKNKMDASEVSAGSNKKYWWKCHTCGYEWQAVVASRTKRNTQCPHCSNSKAIPGYNDLKTLKPEIAQRWDYDKNKNTPDNYLPGSNKKVWWKCPKGHSYERTISIESKGAKCPYCLNLKIIPGENDLATLEPELMNEWDFEKNSLDPKKISSRNDRKAWWICDRGHSWYASIGQRVRTRSGCPQCYYERRSQLGQNQIKNEVSK